MRIKISIIIFIFSSFLYANTENFILNTAGLLDQRAGEEINTMGNEVKSKLRVRVYLDIKGSNGINPDLPLKERIPLMKQKEADLIASIQEDLNETQSYVILTLALDQKYSNILMSENLRNIIDKNSILDEYVIPLLAAQDKNTLNSKVSAACLNGYAEITDTLAENKDIKLVSSIGSEGKVASSIWRVFMYTLVLSGIILYFVVILRERKIKQQSKSEVKNKEIIESEERNHE